MTITLTPQTESLLRKKAEREGADPNAIADTLIAMALQWEAEEQASGNRAVNTPVTRVQELAYYLGTVSNAGDISSETAKAALTVWNDLSQMFRALAVPDAAPGPDRQLLYTWNRGKHHLELEIFPAAPAEFFYYNRDSEATWQEDYRVGDPLSTDAQAKLSIFQTP